MPVVDLGSGPVIIPPGGGGGTLPTLIGSDNGRGWLWWDNVEILNDNRFLRNVNNIGGSVKANFLEACPAYSLDPTSTPQWNALDYKRQPWVEPNSPESGRFLGFWVETATVASILERNVEPRGSARGGANFANIRLAHREIAYTVILAALDPFGLQWGYDWLTAHLSGVLSADDTQMRAQFRIGCTDSTNPTAGLWEMRNVGLITAPTWGTPATDRSGCQLMRVSFVVGAEDPCRYKSAASLAAPARIPFTASGCMEATKWLCGPFPELRLSAVVPAPGSVGTADVIVSIRAGGTGTPAMRIRGGLNPANQPAGSGAIKLITDMVVGGIGPFQTLTIDASNETLTVSSGTTITDALDLVIPPAKDWPTFMSFTGPSNGMVWVEPLNGCGLAEDIFVGFQTVHRVCQ